MSQTQSEVSPKKHKIVYDIGDQVDKFVIELESEGTAVIFIANDKDESSVALLKELQRNQQRLYFLHVEIVCITQSSTQEINEIINEENIVFPITNQDALKYAGLFGAECEDKIKQSAFLIVGKTLKSKYDSFNIMELADTIIRDAAIMIDIDEILYEVCSYLD
jgi:hypothetical protein